MTRILKIAGETALVFVAVLAGLTILAATGIMITMYLHLPVLLEFADRSVQ